VKLVALSNSGCADSTTQTVTVNPKPTVNFSVNTASQCLNANQFLFTNQSSISSGTLTHRWDFGDGGISTSASPSYTYNLAGVYTVKLVVTSSSGCKDSTTRSVTVFAKPQVGFTVNNAAQCINGNSFVFANTTSITSGTVNYAWTFGDGNGANTISATYSYATPGTHTVKLVAISNNGCADSVSQTVTVHPKPTVSFAINAPNQCLTGNQYVFTNQSSISSGTLTHRWTFGDGNSSIQTSPTYSYATIGSYDVKLVSTSALGCRDSLIRSVVVYPMPTGTLATPATNLLCEGGNIQLSATGGATYQWFLNGAAIAGATNATHLATQPGVYTVNLISLNGCTAQAAGTVTLQLIQRPTANFSYEKYCAGFPTQFNDLSNVINSGLVNYSWTFGAGLGSSTLQNPVFTFPTAGVFNVSLLVTPVACPSLTATVTKPVTTVTPPANQRYLSLNAIENRDLQLEVRNFGGAMYSWSPTTGLSSATIYNPVFNHNAEVDYLITITTGIGCVIKDSLLVRIFKEKEIFVPKGFSPNGDGNNDKIFPRLVGVRTLTYFKVYNRWGQLIFQTSNINEGWDGTYRGSKQPMETYVWMAEGIDIDNNAIKRTGTFLLLR
jgi:gliding motility-associated-like protein